MSVASRLTTCRVTTVKVVHMFLAKRCQARYRASMKPVPCRYARRQKGRGVPFGQVMIQGDDQYEFLLTAHIRVRIGKVQRSGECGQMLAVFHLFPVPELGASKSSAKTELLTQRALYGCRLLMQHPTLLPVGSPA